MAQVESSLADGSDLESEMTMNVVTTQRYSKDDRGEKERERERQARRQKVCAMQRLGCCNGSKSYARKAKRRFGNPRNGFANGSLSGNARKEMLWLRDV